MHRAFCNVRGDSGLFRAQAAEALGQFADERCSVPQNDAR
jgi:hypothetical protein